MSSNTSAPVPGWYPAPHANGEQRYWDGSGWTDWTPEAAAAAAASQPVNDVMAGAPGASVSHPKPTPEAKQPTKTKWIIAGSVAAGVIVIGSIAGALGGDRDPGTVAQTPVSQSTAKEPVVQEDERVQVPEVVGKTVADGRSALEAAGFTITFNDGVGDDWIITTQGPEGGTEAEPGLAISLVAEAPQPVYSLEQQNALDSARSYLSFTAFSRYGLIQQLSSEYGEGYPAEVATWAADTVGADWNAEAVESAKSYLDMTSFSRSGLYDQLTSEYGEGFTPDEANHALAQVGY